MLQNSGGREPPNSQHPRVCFVTIIVIIAIAIIVVVVIIVSTIIIIITSFDPRPAFDSLGRGNSFKFVQHDIVIIVGREVTFVTSLIRPEYFGCHFAFWPPKLLPVTNYHGLCFPSEYIPPFGSIRIQCLHVLVHSF